MEEFLALTVPLAGILLGGKAMSCLYGNGRPSLLRRPAIHVL